MRLTGADPRRRSAWPSNGGATLSTQGSGSRTFPMGSTKVEERSGSKVPWMIAGSSMVVALTLAAVVVWPSGDSSSADRGSSSAISSTSSPGSSSPPSSTVVVPITSPPSEGALSGWGAVQPTQMMATVVYGTEQQPMSADRRQLLGEQLDHVRQVVMSIGTVANAERLGYKKNFQRIDGRGWEYINWGYWSDKVDLDKPTMLVFPDTNPDSRVIATAFNVLGTREAGPPDTFPLEVMPWHYHHNLCRKGDSIIGNVETAPDGSLYQNQIDRCIAEGAKFEPELDHWMIDLWIVPGWENPWGLVSSKHPDLFADPQPWFPNRGSGAQTATHH